MPSGVHNLHLYQRPPTQRSCLFLTLRSPHTALKGQAISDILKRKFVDAALQSRGLVHFVLRGPPQRLAISVSQVLLDRLAAGNQSEYFMNIMCIPSERPRSLTSLVVWRSGLYLTLLGVVSVHLCYNFNKRQATTWMTVLFCFCFLVLSIKAIILNH